MLEIHIKIDGEMVAGRITAKDSYLAEMETALHQLERRKKELLEGMDKLLEEATK